MKAGGESLHPLRTAARRYPLEREYPVGAASGRDGSSPVAAVIAASHRGRMPLPRGPSFSEVTGIVCKVARAYVC